jgi:hypothetical protein
MLSEPQSDWSNGGLTAFLGDPARVRFLVAFY